MVHGKKRIPYRIDRRLPGLAVSDYGAAISFGLPYEPEDPQYGEYRLTVHHIRVVQRFARLQFRPCPRQQLS